MLKFTKINQENPSKTPAEKRVKSFDEIYARYAAQKAEEQANDFAMTIEALAEALEVTVDYYLEEFHEVR